MLVVFIHYLYCFKKQIISCSLVLFIFLLCFTPLCCVGYVCSSTLCQLLLCCINKLELSGKTCARRLDLMKPRTPPLMIEYSVNAGVSCFVISSLNSVSHSLSNSRPFMMILPPDLLSLITEYHHSFSFHPLSHLFLSFIFHIWLLFLTPPFSHVSSQMWFHRSPHLSYSTTGLLRCLFQRDTHWPEQAKEQELPAFSLLILHVPTLPPTPVTHRPCRLPPDSRPPPQGELRSFSPSHLMF